MENYPSIKRNTFDSVLMRPMNREPAIQTEVSQKEKQMSHINAYIWNLERWSWWTYLQGSSGDADIKNRLMDTGWGGEDGTNGESGMETHTHYCTLDRRCSSAVRCIPFYSSLYDSGSSAVRLWQPTGAGGGREAQEGADAYIPMADSC